jgi:PPM family protein phosphatase
VTYYRQVWAATHVGHVRRANEDSYCVGDWLCDRSNGGWQGQIDCTLGWAVVADGMGGHAAGEQASESVVRSVMSLAREARSENDVARMLETANERIYREMYDGNGRPAMGSTVVGVILREKRALIFNVGDSRLYVAQGAKLQQESTDDTIIRTIEDRQIKTHALTQSLGGSYSRFPITPHIKHIDLENCAGLLLCSDGLTNMLSDDEIAADLSRRRSDPAQSLVSAALDAGGSDNVTVVVIGAAFS